VSGRVGTSMHHWTQLQLSISNTGVVPLEIDRPWPADVCPESASGAAQDRLIIDNLLVVQLNGDVAIDKRDLHGLPLTGRLLGATARFNPAVDSAHIVGIDWSAIGISCTS